MTETVKCDKCDRPATNFARDVKEIEPQGDARCFDLVGEPKAGCDKHPVKSKVIKTK